MSDDSKQKQAAARAVEVLDGHVLFSRRLRIAHAAMQWCSDHAVIGSPFNIVTALSAMGMLRGGDADTVRLTDAEREAVEWAEAAAYDAQHPAEDVLRGLRERHAKGGGA